METNNAPGTEVDQGEDSGYARATVARIHRATIARQNAIELDCCAGAVLAHFAPNDGPLPGAFRVHAPLAAADALRAAAAALDVAAACIDECGPEAVAAHLRAFAIGLNAHSFLFGARTPAEYEDTSEAEFNRRQMPLYPY